MKNGKIFLALALSSAFVFGCQKETSPSGDPVQPSLRAEIKFTVGEKTYELSAVQRASEISNYTCGGACGDVSAKDFSYDWTTYTSGNLVMVTRQDVADDPALRLSLSGAIDLNASALPAKVANARVTLSDFKNILLEKNDAPNAGTPYFESQPGTAELTITSKNGNEVKGTFSGILKIMPSGASVEIQNGTFTAQLYGL